MPNKLSFGLILPSRGVLYDLCTARDLVRLAEIADQSGVLDRVWVGDSLIGNPRLESVSLLSACAARTSRVNLGVACMASIALRDPVLLATQWASLDHLAEGRTTFVACAGGGVSPNKATEARYYGVETPKVRYGRMVEAMDVLRKLWSGEAVTHKGEHYDLQDVSIGIRPVQKKVPVWLASDTPAETALRRVARRSDGWMAAAVSQADFTARWQNILGFAKEDGRDPGEFGNVLYHNVHITERRDEAYAESKRFLKAYYGQEWPDSILEYWLHCGTPEYVAERLSAWRDTGVQNIALRLAAWDQFGQIERLIKEVLPLVR